MTDPTLLAVRARSQVYHVLVGQGLLDATGREVAKLSFIRPGATCAIITDDHVAPLYLDRVVAGLRGAGFQPTAVVVPSGEHSKSMERVSATAEALIAAGLDRQSFVVALGGGVVGDLAGFVASIYYRGIPYVQIPTTIVAQVDSAIGGKTGVNTVSGKNLLGAFHPPGMVLVDPVTLDTLPAREFNEGFAEVIKHGIIQDAALFEQLFDFERGNRARLTGIIRRNLEIKADIVARDEFEQLGVRALLNFGHTVGHGIEQAGGYGRFLHGEAVSLGIVAAARLSEEKASLPSKDRERIFQLLKTFELPIALPPEVTTEAIMAALRRDKKFESGEIRFVLTPSIGTARLSAPGEVTADDLHRAVERLRAQD